MSNRIIYIGGLLRCCIDYIRDYHGPEKEGTMIQCESCFAELIIDDGKWMWNR